MLPDEFDELARLAPRAVEGIRLEFINGRLCVASGRDGSHARTVQWLVRSCLDARPELWLYDQGLAIQADGAGRARPDGVLAVSGTFAGQGEWARLDGVLMVAEVTGCDAETDRRDRVEKPRAYAESGIPLYLLIDRDSAEVTVYSEPGGVRYENAHTLPFGKTVHLPEPAGFSLDTEPLKNWVR